MFKEFLKKYQGKFDEATTKLAKEMSNDYDAFWKEAINQSNEDKIRLDGEVKKLIVKKEWLEKESSRLSEEVILFNEKIKDQEEKLATIQANKEAIVSEVVKSKEKMEEIAKREKEVEEKEVRLNKLESDIGIKESILEEKQTNLKKIWDSVNNK